MPKLKKDKILRQAILLDNKCYKVLILKAKVCECPIIAELSRILDSQST